MGVGACARRGSGRRRRGTFRPCRQSPAALARRPHRGRRGQSLFPSESLNRTYLTESRARSLCPWKGIARYYTVTVDGAVNLNAAWYYPHPSPFAMKIKNHVAFWYGVTVEAVPEEST
jgi:uncharacterized protein (DUF427 family)